MQVFLEVINGRYAGTTYSIAADQVCMVGARFGADLLLPNDSLLAPLHFILKHQTEFFEVEKLSGELFVNNEPLEKGNLAHNDYILAGETLFQFTIESKPIAEETVLGKLIEHLLKIENLFLLVDENLDRRILAVLNEFDAKFRELKKNVKGFERMNANPIIAAIDGNRKLLEILVRSFWGKGILVFFSSNKNRAEMFKYLQFLMAKTQIDGGGDLRFYDPRILRVVLGEADQKQAQFFFGAADRYFVESQLPSHLFKFGLANGNITADLIRLSDTSAKIPTQNEIADFLADQKMNQGFYVETEVCLQQFLPDISVDFRNLIEESLPLFERYKINSVAAKIQLVALNAVFGSEFGESAEIVELFSSNHYSADDKLVILTERINRNRG